MGQTNPANIKPGSIVGTDLSLSADIPAETMRHTFVASTKMGIAYGTHPVANTDYLYVFNGPGKIMGFHAMVANSGSAASITVDLQKNGVSVLTTPITITNATPANTTQTATLLLTPTTCVSGDVLRVVLGVGSSTGMQGFVAWATIQETTSPV